MADLSKALEFLKVRPFELAIAIVVAFGLDLLFRWSNYSKLSLQEFLVVFFAALIFLRLLRYARNRVVRKRKHAAHH